MDLSNGLKLPLYSDARAFDNGPGTADTESTQQGGLWADSDKNVVYKYFPPCHVEL